MLQLESDMLDDVTDPRPLAETLDEATRSTPATPVLAQTRKGCKECVREPPQTVRRIRLESLKVEFKANHRCPAVDVRTPVYGPVKNLQWTPPVFAARSHARRTDMRILVASIYRDKPTVSFPRPGTKGLASSPSVV